MQYVLSVGGISPILEAPHRVGVYLYSLLNHNMVSQQPKQIVSRLRPGLKSRGYHAPGLLCVKLRG